MRILYLTPGVFDKGGISRYNRYQIQALRDLLGPDQIVTLSLLGPSQSASDLETPFAVQWHGQSAAHVGLGGMAAFAMRARALGRKLQPDIVWSSHLHFSALSWALARTLRALHVMQVYGLEVWTPRPSRPDVQWGFRRCDRVVSDCHFTAQYVERRYPAHAPVEVIWDCVDTSRFYPAGASPEVLGRYGIPDPTTSFNVMTLGRLSASAAYKGYERLLDVFPRLPSHAHLVYCGGGDLIPSLAARAQALGVAERVIFTGFIDEEHLPDVYRSASVFSLVGDRGQGRGEGIPLTPLEAAACSVPILVGNQDGSAEAVQQGVNGFALDPFDLDALGDVLNRLALDTEERLRLGSAARERIERQHSYTVFRSQLGQFLAKTMPGHSGLLERSL